MTAVGVARPRAQGHATTSTAMQNRKEKLVADMPSGISTCPLVEIMSQIPSTMTANVTIAGTKIPAMRSGQRRETTSWVSRLTDIEENIETQTKEKQFGERHKQ